MHQKLKLVRVLKGANPSLKEPMSGSVDKQPEASWEKPVVWGMGVASGREMFLYFLFKRRYIFSFLRGKKLIHAFCGDAMIRTCFCFTEGF